MPTPSTIKGSIRFVLPNRRVDYPTGQGSDLICPAECLRSEDPCCSLQKKCIPLLEESIFANSSLCRKNNTNNTYHFCISHPTIEMNTTKIHFFYEKHCTRAGPLTRIPIAEYVKAVEIIITGIVIYYYVLCLLLLESINNYFFIHAVPPPPPKFTVNKTTGEICIQTQSDERFPADFYKINITDVTGYEIFRNESVTAECTRVDALLVFQCAPFTIKVIGTNRYGDSRQTEKLIDTGKLYSMLKTCLYIHCHRNYNTTIIYYMQQQV